MVHVVFVPAILWSAMLWLTQYAVDLPPAVASAVPSVFVANAALLVALVCTCFSV